MQSNRGLGQNVKNCLCGGVILLLLYQGRCLGEETSGIRNVG